jgi:hypothetical protein
MMNAAFAADMSVDGHVVRRVRENKFSFLAFEQYVEGGRVEGIATEQPVVAQGPQIAQPADSAAHKGLVAFVFATRTFAVGLSGNVQDYIDLPHLKATELDFKVQVDQPLKLDGKKLTVPARLLCKLIVRQDVGPLLGSREMRQPQNGNGGELELLGRSHASMAGNDNVFVVDQRRTGKAEAPHAFDDLLNLFTGVGSGVAGIGLQPANRHELHFVTHPDRHRTQGTFRIWQNGVARCRR